MKIIKNESVIKVNGKIKKQGTTINIGDKVREGLLATYDNGETQFYPIEEEHIFGVKTLTEKEIKNKKKHKNIKQTIKKQTLF